MKTKFFFTLVAAGLGLFALQQNAFAQTEETNRDANGNIVRGPYLACTFSENWFIEVGGGAGIYLGGLNDNFGKRIRPVIDLSVGKWITPLFAVRLAGTYTPRYYEYSGNNEYSFYYWGVRGDFMWDMITTIGGYKEKRVYTLLPFVGAGYAQIGNATHFSYPGHEFTLTAGLVNKFRLCSWCDFNLEIRGTASNHYFDRIPDRKTTIDAPLSVTGGFTFTFGKKHFSRASSYASSQVAAAVAPKDAEIAALAAAKAKADAENARLAKTLDSLKAIAPTHTTDTLDISNLPEVIVFFDLGKSDLNAKEASHFETFVHYVKYSISCGKSVNLIGSADKQTGSDATNVRLGKERAELVKNILVEQYGVPADKLNTVSDGAKNNRFPIQEMNRCVWVKF